MKQHYCLKKDRWVEKPATECPYECVQVRTPRKSIPGAETRPKRREV